MSWEATLNESFVKLSNSTKQIIKKSTFYKKSNNLKLQIDYLKLQLKMGLMNMKNQ